MWILSFHIENLLNEAHIRFNDWNINDSLGVHLDILPIFCY